MPYKALLNDIQEKIRNLPCMKEGVPPKIDNAFSEIGEIVKEIISLGNIRVSKALDDYLQGFKESTYLNYPCEDSETAGQVTDTVRAELLALRMAHAFNSEHMVFCNVIQGYTSLLNHYATGKDKIAAVERVEKETVPLLKDHQITSLEFFTLCCNIREMSPPYRGINQLYF